MKVRLTFIRLLFLNNNRRFRCLDTENVCNNINANFVDSAAEGRPNKVSEKHNLTNGRKPREQLCDTTPTDVNGELEPSSEVNNTEVTNGFDELDVNMPESSDPQSVDGQKEGDAGDEGGSQHNASGGSATSISSIERRLAAMISPVKSRHEKATHGK